MGAHQKCIYISNGHKVYYYLCFILHHLKYICINLYSLIIHLYMYIKYIYINLYSLIIHLYMYIYHICTSMIYVCVSQVCVTNPIWLTLWEICWKSTLSFNDWRLLKKRNMRRQWNMKKILNFLVIQTFEIVNLTGVFTFFYQHILSAFTSGWNQRKF